MIKETISNNTPNTDQSGSDLFLAITYRSYDDYINGIIDYDALYQDIGWNTDAPAKLRIYIQKIKALMIDIFNDCLYLAELELYSDDYQYSCLCKILEDLYRQLWLHCERGALITLDDLTLDERFGIKLVIDKSLARLRLVKQTGGDSAGNE